jgi:hypothetical protein
MHRAARLKPVVIDESRTDYEALLLAREMGYSGAALKACKGVSHSILSLCSARQFGMFLCVQHLTCPGASLLLSAGLAAHAPGVRAVEANAGQYVPSANAVWERSSDFSIVKRFRMAERATLQFRVDACNGWNQANGGAPNASPTNSAFGRITSTAGDACNWQPGLKLSF